MLDPNHDYVGRYDLKDDSSVSGAYSKMARELSRQGFCAGHVRPAAKPLDNLQNTRADDYRKLIKIGLGLRSQQNLQ